MNFCCSSYAFLLLFATFFTEFQIFRVVHFVVVNASHCHLDGAGGDVVHELAVVADDDDRLSVIDEEVFQPLDGLDVQMIGGLVQQKHIRFLQQQFGKFDAHAPATAEVACLAVEVLSGKPKAKQCLFHIFFVVGSVDGIEFLAQGGHLFDEFHVAVAFIVGAGFQLFVHAVYFGFHFVQVGKGLCRFLKDGTSVFCHQVLGQVGDNTVFGR